MDDPELAALRAKRMAELQGGQVRTARFETLAHHRLAKHTNLLRGAHE